MVASVLHQCMVKNKKAIHISYFHDFISPNEFFLLLFFFLVRLFVQSAEEMLTSHSKSLSGVSVPFSDITDGLLLVIIINIVAWARAGKIDHFLGAGEGPAVRVWNVNSSGD